MKKLNHMVVLKGTRSGLRVLTTIRLKGGCKLNENEVKDLGVAAIQHVHSQWWKDSSIPRTSMYWVEFAGTMEYLPTPNRDDEPFPVIHHTPRYPAFGYK